MNIGQDSFEVASNVTVWIPFKKQTSCINASFFPYFFAICLFFSLMNALEGARVHPSGN